MIIENFLLKRNNKRGCATIPYTTIVLSIESLKSLIMVSFLFLITIAGTGCGPQKTSSFTRLLIADSIKDRPMFDMKGAYYVDQNLYFVSKHHKGADEYVQCPITPITNAESDDNFLYKRLQPISCERISAEKLPTQVHFNQDNSVSRQDRLETTTCYRLYGSDTISPLFLRVTSVGDQWRPDSICIKDPFMIGDKSYLEKQLIIPPPKHNPRLIKGSLAFLPVAIIGDAAQIIAVSGLVIIMIPFIGLGSILS
jgi:hypothetical protein